jgi:hypothetical protein
MNAPELRYTTPLLIALVGLPSSGRDLIARHLKREHGFAMAALEQPVMDAMYSLYGVSPLELLEGKDRPLEILNGNTVRNLVQGLATHARTIAGEEILLRRLVDRATARGDWQQRDLVITDLRNAQEITWLRSQGGFVWWVRRDPFAPCCSPADLAAIQRLMVEHYRSADSVVLNDRTASDLPEAVDAALCFTRKAYEERAALL